MKKIILAATFALLIGGAGGVALVFQPQPAAAGPCPNGNC
jgi:hypothetical protein